MRQKISQQLLPLLSSEAAGESWPKIIKTKLGVAPGPGWPDKFGEKLRKWFEQKKSKKIKALSLFSGGGGLDIAFHDAGFDIVEMVEFEERFCKTLTKNTAKGNILAGATVRCMDIRDYVPSDSLKVDFIVGGPPCQTFSAAGRRAAGVKGTSDPRGTLFQEYVRLLKKLKPRGFLFENVYGITGAEGGKAWQEIQQAFSSAGYTIKFRVLDAADYGVPQHRERLFIVGIRSGDPAELKYKFPRPTHGPDAKVPCDFYSAGIAVKGGFKPDTTSIEIKGRWGHLIAGIPPGLNYSFYTKEIGHPKPIFAWRSKFSDFMYKADPDMPVRTIKAQGGAYTGPFSWENRHFSSSEIKRLQTFPDNYEVVGGRNVQVHQLGNSVPPQIGRILALSVKDKLFGQDLPIQLEYLDEGDVLGFRTRKREQTDYYASKAHEAIALISKAPTKARKLFRIGSQLHLSSKFDLTVKPGKHPAASSAVVTKAEKGKEIRLELNIREENAADASCLITLEPTLRNEWSINIGSASVKLTSASLISITLGWKALELTIREQHGIDDLVQLYGYYQYTPKFSAKIKFFGNWGRDDKLCSLISQIAQGTAVGKQMSLYEMSELFAIKPAALETHLKDLRILGYEIRSHNTNPQIKPGEYLIPYTFPSLTNRSVQLGKKL
jgi:DNA (cytosine-5)-methyltransferase 1